MLAQAANVHSYAQLQTWQRLWLLGGAHPWPSSNSAVPCSAMDSREAEVARLHQQLVRVYDRVRERVIDGVMKQFASPPYEVDPDVIARLDQRWKERVDERLKQMATLEMPSSARGNEERDIVQPLFGPSARESSQAALPPSGFQAFGLPANVRMRAAPVRDGPDEPAVKIRTPVNNIEYFPPNFEGLVLGCIDADFCK